MALPLPSRARHQLDRLLQPYRSAFPGPRWLEPEAWHVTLLFLGSVDPARVRDLQNMIDEVAHDHEPFRVRSGPGGGRGRDGEGVAWLGLGVGAAAVEGLADELAVRHAGDVSATPGGLPRRTPVAHLTVARRAGDGLMRALRAGSHGPLAASWAVDRVVLYRSHLQAGGARYESLHEAGLGTPRSR